MTSLYKVLKKKQSETINVKEKKKFPENILCFPNHLDRLNRELILNDYREMASAVTFRGRKQSIKMS